MANEVMGVDVLVYAGSKLVAGQRDCSISLSGETIDTTTKDNGNWKTSAVGLLEWKISLTAVEFNGQDGYSQSLFEKNMLRRKPFNIKAVAGNKVFSGTAIITSKEISGSNSEVCTGSYELVGNSALEVSYAPFIEKATFSGTSVSVKLSEYGTAVNGNIELKDRISIENCTVANASVSNGMITLTTDIEPSLGAKASILGETLKNGEAVQVGTLYASLVAE